MSTESLQAIRDNTRLIFSQFESTPAPNYKLLNKQFTPSAIDQVLAVAS
ncbi:MAG: hypothetical protein R3E08_03840 [Thiotrichaceae bacterium]